MPVLHVVGPRKGSNRGQRVGLDLCVRTTSSVRKVGLVYASRAACNRQRGVADLGGRASGVAQRAG